MLLVRRTARRIKGSFWGLVYGAIGIAKALRYRWQLLRLGVSESYIREAFSYLAQLNVSDRVAREKGVKLRLVRAMGLEVHVQEERLIFEAKACGESWGKVYEFVLFQDHNGQLVVHEWREETRVLDMGWNEFSRKHETHWWEVFRSGSFIHSTRFVEYLKKLYGTGPDAELQRLMA